MIDLETSVSGESVKYPFRLSVDLIITRLHSILQTDLEPLTNILTLDQLIKRG